MAGLGEATHVSNDQITATEGERGMYKSRSAEGRKYMYGVKSEITEVVRKQSVQTCFSEIHRTTQGWGEKPTGNVKFKVAMMKTGFQVQPIKRNHQYPGYAVIQDGTKPRSIIVAVLGIAVCSVTMPIVPAPGPVLVTVLTT